MQNKIKMILASSGNTYRSVAPAFNCSPETAVSKIGRGLKSLKDYVKLCDFCNAKITITLQDGSVLNITKEDFL